MNHKLYYEKAMDEIVEMIRDNLILKYCFTDDALLSLKEYCKDKEGKRYKEIPYELLFDFTKEGLKELINCDFLYDFRDLE